MLLFASDIDNTLIYSHKRENISSKKIPCELYNGENISFITEYTRNKLELVNKNALFIPVTTRSVEQYQRIKFGDFIPEYALTSNGGNLLINGQADKEWYESILKEISPAFYGLEKGEKYLKHHENRILDVKRVDGLFTYTKSDAPEKTVGSLKELLINEPVKVYNYHNKIYILPNNLDKGSALKKFVHKYMKNVNKVITAGDSVFDIPLLKAGNLAVFPKSLDFIPDTKYLKFDDNDFSDKLLNEVIKHL